MNVLPLAPTLLVVSLLLSAPASQALEYRIDIRPDNPLQARVDVKAPQYNPHEAPVRLTSTQALNADGHRWGIRELISDVRCDGQAIKPTPAGWSLPPEGCLHLNWRIAFGALSGHRPSQAATGLTNVFHPDSQTWLLSLDASLLRWPGTEGARILIAGAPVMRAPAEQNPEPSAPAAAAPDLRLPALSDPPAYVLLGAPPVSVQRLGPYRLSYLRWAKGNSAELGALERAHAHALVRFAQTTEQPLPRAVVLWLPIDARQGRASAVSSALVAIGNTPSDPTGALAAGLPYALVTLLHAQFAQMLGERLPPWVRISLAEYGARKALPLSGLDAQTIARIEAGYPDPQQGPSQSLLQAQAQLNDPATSAQAYTQLMLEGANFWLALDRAIQVHSNGQQNLEDALAAIATARYDSDTTLPLPLAQRLQHMAGTPAFNALLQRYVGLSP